ncbi:hypothetical protein KP509_18G007700 [Ceratopteris richardii]|uniref:Terpene synthase n=1 Tax=Ceratopteris richardii TaxID=49495 RepID=A0A8T2SM84_CERRI|nr:hypothetical protein KP509_18G007700 [Ceratopteris richardii]
MYWSITFDDAIDNNSSMCNDPVQAQKYCTLFLDIVFGHGRDSTKTRRELLEEAKQKYSSKEMLPLRLGIQWWEEMKHEGMPSSQQNRFEAELTKYVMAQVQIVRMNEQLGLKGSIPSLLEYVRVRRVAVGAPASIVASEYDLGIDLDPQILHDPLVLALQDAVSDHVAWLNDILSFPKEFRRGELINLVFLIHIENNHILFGDYNGSAVDLIASLDGNEERTGSFDAAACRAWEMTKSRYEDCARLASEIMGSPHLSAMPHVKRYVEAICSITIGNWAWSLRCGRYNAPTISSYVGCLHSLCISNSPNIRSNISS